MEDMYRRMMGPPLYVALFFKLPQETNSQQKDKEPFVEIFGLHPPFKNWIN